MKRKHWTDKEKFNIVLQGLKGNIPVSELCSTYEVHQSQYYKWKELFLSKGMTVFNENKANHKERQMETKIKKMQSVIGELTMELKKND